jgi:hypothetical protein
VLLVDRQGTGDRLLPEAQELEQGLRMLLPPLRRRGGTSRPGALRRGLRDGPLRVARDSRGKPPGEPGLAARSVSV